VIAAVAEAAWLVMVHRSLRVPNATITQRTLRSRADRDRWPCDQAFSDTSHQDARTYASAHA
jgi:hypothetical protein